MSLIFAMGKYEASIPTDRMYSENHLWVQPGPGGFRVGFSAYSVRLLQDVYFLDWSVGADAVVKFKQEIGEIESSKAVSTLYPPGDGRIGHFNDVLLNDPSLINSDGYGQGWLYTFETQARFMSPEQYVEFLGTKWEATQRLIKGQLNE